MWIYNYGQLVQRNTTNLSRFTKVDIDVSVNDIALTMAPSSQTTAYVDNIGRYILWDIVMMVN